MNKMKKPGVFLFAGAIVVLAVMAALGITH